eukprot:COSAG02_NODE_22651_length_745_cov_0.876161_2_plen_130_part_01
MASPKLYVVPEDSNARMTAENGAVTAAALSFAPIDTASITPTTWEPSAKQYVSSLVATIAGTYTVTVSLSYSRDNDVVPNPVVITVVPAAAAPSNTDAYYVGTGEQGRNDLAWCSSQLTSAHYCTTMPGK